jgi:hypothetical protein
VGKHRKGGRMEAVMTDYQFKSIIKMVKTIVDKSETKEEIALELEKLIGEEKSKNSD